jgi:hypothetical protein
LSRFCAFPGALLLAFASLACACSKTQPTADDPFKPQPQSTVTLVNAMGVCDDVPLCERECDGGAGDRCRRLGATYEFGKDGGKDDVRATSYYERACGLGNSEGCVSAGRMYEFAHGVAKDDTKAAGFYDKACTIGDQVGCANLGILVEAGRGVKQDLARAKELYGSACKAGAGLACDRLKRLAATADGG